MRTHWSLHMIRSVLFPAIDVIDKEGLYIHAGLSEPYMVSLDQYNTYHFATTATMLHGATAIGWAIGQQTFFLL